MLSHLRMAEFLYKWYETGPGPKQGKQSLQWFYQISSMKLQCDIPQTIESKKVGIL